MVPVEAGVGPRSAGVCDVSPADSASSARSPNSAPAGSCVDDRVRGPTANGVRATSMIATDTNRLRSPARRRGHGSLIRAQHALPGLPGMRSMGAARPWSRHAQLPGGDDRILVEPEPERAHRFREVRGHIRPCATVRRCARSSGSVRHTPTRCRAAATSAPVIPTGTRQASRARVAGERPDIGQRLLVPLAGPAPVAPEVAAHDVGDAVVVDHVDARPGGITVEPEVQRRCHGAGRAPPAQGHDDRIVHQHMQTSRGATLSCDQPACVGPCVAPTRRVGGSRRS